VVSIIGASVVGPQNSVVYRLTDGRYFIPSVWRAGGGGLARMSDAQAAALGGVPSGPVAGLMDAELQAHDQYGNITRPPAHGYIFKSDPSAKGVAAGQTGVSYTPGTGSGLKGDLLTLAPLAGPFIVYYGAEVLGGAAAAGGGAAAGAADIGFVMPGAVAVSSGATGGILAETSAAAFIMPGAEAVASGATGGIAAEAPASFLSAATGLAPAPTLAQTATGALSALKASLGAIGAVETAVQLASPKKTPTLAPRAAVAPAPAQTSASSLLLAVLGLVGLMMVA
jgi:hypothetical protein